MAKINTLLLFIFSLHCLLVTSESGWALSTAGATDLIKSECRTTRYPALCIQCLSNHSSPILTRRQLVQAALSVSLSRAQLAAGFISKLARMRGMKAGEYAAVQDCMANVGATVDQLSRSMKELRGLHEQATSGTFTWHVGNVQTWVSAALTNENTCIYGFSGAAMDGNVKAAIRRRILDCAQIKWLQLSQISGVSEVPKFSREAESYLRNLINQFSLDDALEVEKIEKVMSKLLSTS